MSLAVLMWQGGILALLFCSSLFGTKTLTIVSICSFVFTCIAVFTSGLFVLQGITILVGQMWFSGIAEKVDAKRAVAKKQAELDKQAAELAKLNNPQSNNSGISDWIYIWGGIVIGGYLLATITAKDFAKSAADAKQRTSPPTTPTPDSRPPTPTLYYPSYSSYRNDSPSVENKRERHRTHKGDKQEDMRDCLNLNDDAAIAKCAGG